MEVIREFEELLESHYPGTKAIAVNSGTSALIACLKSLDINHGEVITTPFSFQATGDAIVLAGGTPVFADISSDDNLISPTKIRQCITSNTVCILPVSLFGRHLKEQIFQIGKKYKLPIIQDDAQNFLNKWGEIADAKCFSFYRTKNLQAGEGGAILVKTDGMLDYDKIWSICNNGRRKNMNKYQHYNIGYNFRMSEHTALILYNQLKYHEKAISAGLCSYNESHGYYPHLIYQQPSFIELGITGNCPVAEKLVKKIRNCS